MKIETQERVSAIVTVIIQAILIINALLTAAGRNPIPLDETQTSEFLTYAVTIGWNVWAWWRNNNITNAAIEGQKIVNAEKEKERDISF